MSEDIKKKIIDDLERSGFPAEIQAAAELEKFDWMVYNSPLFIDKEDGSQREIDIHALHIDYTYSDLAPELTEAGEENKLITHIVAEVKKSDKPWVFFQNGGRRWPTIPSQNLKSQHDEFHSLFLQNIDDIPSMVDFGLGSHRYAGAALHKTFHVAFSSPQQPSKIYECLIKTNKAIKYLIDRYGSGKYVLHCFVPVIILDGTLWSATMDKSGELHITKSNHIVAQFHTIETTDGFTGEMEQIYDIVTLDGINDFLKLLTSEQLSLYSAWTRFVNLEFKEKAAKKMQKKKSKKKRQENSTN